MLKLEAVDVLIFGDGKPFNAGEQNFREGEYFINPIPIVSALNRITGEEHNITYISFIKNDTFFFKTPTDIKKVDKEIKTPELKKIDKDEYFSNVKQLEYILDYNTEKKLSSPAGFISEEGLKSYLCGETLKDEHFEELLFIEERTGISIDRATRTTKEGYLYFQNFIRFDKNTGIIIKTDESTSVEHISLGGESRISKIEKIDIDLEARFKELKDEIMKKVEERGFFKILLLTPSNNIPKIKDAKLIIQQVPDIITYSSWFNIYEKNEKKGSYPSRIFRLIPEGSVFYYKLEDKNELDVIFKDFWLKPAFYTNEYPFFDKKNPMGFGLSIIGAVNMEGA